jgi:hypothetical protein
MFMILSSFKSFAIKSIREIRVKISLRLCVFA